MIPIPSNESLGIAGAEEETADTVNFLHFDPRVGP
jgi:hypothetical protein